MGWAGGRLIEEIDLLGSRSLPRDEFFAERVPPRGRAPDTADVARALRPRIAGVWREHGSNAPTLAGSEGGSHLQLSGRTMLSAIADDLEQILDDTGWREPVAVAGSSFGGVIAALDALALAARPPAAKVVDLRGLPHQPHLRDPERIARLILELS
jgi:alpha-beta hydrolase superfamily lysophospholipase